MRSRAVGGNARSMKESSKMSLGITFRYDFGRPPPYRLALDQAHEKLRMFGQCGDRLDEQEKQLRLEST